VPDGMAVTVVENTDKQFHLVLPPVPSDELSDEALDAVAGGMFSMILGGIEEAVREHRAQQHHRRKMNDR